MKEKEQEVESAKAAARELEQRTMMTYIEQETRMTALRQTLHRDVELLRRRYAWLETREKERQRVAAESAAELERRERERAAQQHRTAPYMNHDCDGEYVLESHRRGDDVECVMGYMMYFARHTPDEKLVAEPRKYLVKPKFEKLSDGRIVYYDDHVACEGVVGRSDYSEVKYSDASEACRVYQETFLLGRGLSKEDIAAMRLLKLRDKYLGSASAKP